ncbi:MAG: VOC family protein [Acidimicrobiia bacterium]|nr:VOC family protein [Acidimicrobiia bacterium]NNL98900.1 VOC family protein [Acidimicrobiia bacterium]
MASIDGNAIPILPSSDLARTAEHYTRLGFEELSRWDDYLIIKRDSAELHFFLESGVRGGGCYLRISDAPALHHEWSQVEGATVFPVVATEYGLDEFAIHDPDGNQIRIGSPR